MSDLEGTSVAIVGGSRSRFYTQTLLANLRGYGCEQPVYLVNPRHHGSARDDEVASVLDIPDQVGLGVVQVRADRVLGVVRQLRDRGCTMVVVFSDGFADAGTAEGRALQDDLVSAASDLGVTIVGPNSMGFADLHAARVAVAGPIPAGVTAGDTSILSDSGAMISSLLTFAARERVGVHRAISVGNGAGCDIRGWLEAACDWPGTGALWVYSEGIPDGAEGLDDVLRVLGDRGKTISWYLSGVSAAGRAAAQSHTGRLMSRQAEAHTYLRSRGVMVYESLDLMARGAALERVVRPYVDRPVAVLSSSGGGAIAGADGVSRAGLRLAEFTDRTVMDVREHLGERATVTNPFDFTAGSGDVDAFRGACRAFTADADVGLVLYAFPVRLPDDDPLGERHTAKLLALAESATVETPVIVATIAPQEVPPHLRELETRFPYFTIRSGVDATLRAVADLAEAGTVPRRLMRRGAQDRPETDRAASAGQVLEEARATKALEAAGVTFVAHRVVTTPDEAVDVSREWQEPLVLKGVVPGLAHKQGADLVRVGICSEQRVRQTVAELLQRAGSLGDGEPGDAPQVIVQPLVRGVEFFLAVRRPSLGDDLEVMFGLGGVLAECSDHLSTGATPAVGPIGTGDLAPHVRAAGLTELVDRLHPGVLGGIATCLDAAVRFLDSDEGRACSLVELNPVIVRADGSCVAVDSLIITSS